MAMQEEVVAEFEHEGADFQIDHLGILHPNQWGEYAIYRGDDQVGEFGGPAAGLLEEYRPAEPTADELIAMTMETLGGKRLGIFDQILANGVAAQKQALRDAGVGGAPLELMQSKTER